ncbi:UUP1 family membrane protein [Coleofasciculus sp.]|uniref:UUP1 family membrane protein n=1 Tax=Coleofasciculus sp. TaxID=3100458 RepID=UPI0039FA4ACB
MNRTFKALLLTLFLAAIGLSIFIHKLIASDVPLLPNQAFKSWYIEAKISFVSQPSPLMEEELPTTVKFHLPQDSQRYNIVEDDFVNEGFTREIETDKKSANRLAVFTKQDSNDVSDFIFYRANIKRKAGLDPIEKDVPISGRRLVDKQMIRFGENTERAKDNLQENLPVTEIINLIQEANAKSRDRLSFVQTIYQLALNPEDIRIKAISRNVRKPDSTVQVAAFLLERAEVPVRVGNGIFLRGEEVYSTDFVEWLEVRDGDEWLVFDPLDQSFKAQNSYLTWWYGTDRILQAQGANQVDLEVVVQPDTNQGLTQSILDDEKPKNPFLEYSFLRLPLATRCHFNSNGIDRRWASCCDGKFRH